jgi:hypothetical protein
MGGSRLLFPSFPLHTQGMVEHPHQKSRVRSMGSMIF